MSQYDTGATSALASGFGLGMQGLNARRQHEMNLQRMALAQQAAQQRMAQFEQQMQMQKDNLAVRRRGQDRLDQQAWDKEQQTYADQQANADIYARGVLAPQAGAAYMQGDHSDDSFIDTAQGLIGQRNQFAGMSPEAQKPSLANYYRGQAEETSTRNSLARSQMMLDQKLGNVDKLIAEAGGPEKFRPGYVQEMRAKIIAGHSPGHDITPEQYQTWPSFRQMDPESQKSALDFVSQNGQPPPASFFAKKTKDSATSAAEVRLRATAARHAYDRANDSVKEATSALSAFQKANKDELKPPTDRPPTDPAWATYNAAKQQEKPLRDAVEQAKKKRADIAKQADEADNAMFGTPTSARPAPGQSAQNLSATLNGMSVDDAAAAVAKAHPDLDHNNPAHQAIIKAEMLKLMRGQQQQPAPSPDDYQSDPTDDGDDTEPDFDPDDEEY